MVVPVEEVTDGLIPKLLVVLLLLEVPLVAAQPQELETMVQTEEEEVVSTALAEVEVELQVLVLLEVEAIQATGVLEVLVQLLQYQAHL
jgi:hypothetical protein